MQVPILNGVYSDSDGDYRIAYPVNLIPVVQSTGISDSYLRPADGIEQVAYSIGNDRGGIVVNGVLYRVIGNAFWRVNSDLTITNIGIIPGTGQVSMAYSFDNIAISAAGLLYYYAFSTGLLTQVTDPFLGVCLYINWLDGFFVSTDGNYIISSNLSAPATFNALNYGSSEVVPDSINSIQILRNQMYAVNRYSIEKFEVIGGQFFPFQRVDGGFVPRGAVSPFSCIVFEDSLAMVGSGQNEPNGVWMIQNSNMLKISTKEIDAQISRYSDDDLSDLIIETRLVETHRFLYIHLPHSTYVYDAGASNDLGNPVWFVLRSTISGEGRYNAYNFNYAYGSWFCGNPSDSGLNRLRSDIGSHYGQPVGWEFNTIISYNEMQGGIFYEMELAGLIGNVANATIDPMIWTTYSNNSGVTWSMVKARRSGRQGQREKRINWLQCGVMNDRRIQKFSGTSDSHLTFAALEVRTEPLIN